MPPTREQLAHDQEAVARHLIAAVRRRFSGEAPDLERIFKTDPAQHVVLGVLDPVEPPFAPPAHPDLPDEPGVPVDVLPPSEIGVTVWLDAVVGAREITFDVDIDFAVYLPVFPTWEEQTTWMTGARAADLEEASPEVRTDDDDQAVGDDAVAGEDPETDGDSTPAIFDTPDDAAPDDDTAPAARRSSRSVRLAPVHERHLVTAHTQITAPLRRGVVDDAGVAQAALDQVITAALPTMARPLRGRAKQGVSIDAVQAGRDAYDAELVERVTGDLPPLPEVKMLVGVMEDPRGGWRINLTLANTAQLVRRRDRAQQCLYDARFVATIDTGTFRNLGYRLSERDWRTDPQVFAHGRFCVGDVSEDRRTVATNTWPVYRDCVFESRPEAQPTFQQLIDDPIGTLDGIATMMRTFATDWEAYAASAPLDAEQRAACDRDLVTFSDEADRFARGVDLLRRDQRLLDAFVGANRAFLVLNTPNALHPDPAVTAGVPRITSWRLFQIVFIVLGLAALAAREHDDAALQAELGIADVLWFPTGGGKSEAFLGLVAVALFFDRLRGKSIGVSALIRFPLRMLSVQQLDRVLRLLAACEHVRTNDLGSTGSPFELGYFVGRFNTPNRLTDANDDRWGDITRMARWSEEERRRNVVITTCPFCSSTEVELVADRDDVRLHHRCTSCTARIPVVISDDEVFRTMPSVIVATVDKAAAIAFQPHFSHLTHGPAFSCPKHGYVTFPGGPASARRCLARRYCDLDPASWDPVHAYDPAPALVVQDELHLIAEDLGTLAAHYETLFAHLCRKGSGRAPKIIAATATISDYENQVRQLYALEPRRFPSEGYREGETFYAARRDLTRRLFVGVLPSRLDTAQFGIAAGQAWREELDRLRATPAAQIATYLGLQGHRSDAEVAELLFRYELQLFYANRKNDAERTHEQMRRTGERGPSFFEAELLTGNTPLAEISAAIRRVDGENLTDNPDPASRLAVVAGTSLVSHGVDLARLNVLHVAGMPGTNAYYIQATARAGRTDVGVVFTAYSRSFARDRAAFHFFEPHHEYANQLVEAVSLNRFAVNGPRKTATGVLAALLLNGFARDTTLNPATGNVIPNFMLSDTFRDWLRAQHANFDAVIEAEVLEAYGLSATVLDPVVASYFEVAVRDRLFEEVVQLRNPMAGTIQRCFLNKPPSSFRDIDEPVEFGAYGYHSGNDFKTLTNRRDSDSFDGSEAPVADEHEVVD